MSHSLSHRCTKPLVIVPATEGTRPPRRLDRIVAGADGSTSSAIAVRWAAEEAQLHGALLEVVTAWSGGKRLFPADFELGHPLDTALESAAGAIGRAAAAEVMREGLKVEVTVREGRPADVLIERARSADLLVVGTRGRGRAGELLLGSVSHNCSHQSPVPVAIIPHN